MNNLFVFSAIFIKLIALTVTKEDLECVAKYDNLKENARLLETESIFQSLPQPSLKDLTLRETIKTNLERIGEIIVLAYKNTTDIIVLCEEVISYLDKLTVLRIHHIPSALKENISIALFFVNRIIISMRACNDIFRRLNNLSIVYGTEIDVDYKTFEHFGIDHTKESSGVVSGCYSMQSMPCRTYYLLKTLKCFFSQNLEKFPKLIEIWKIESKKVFDSVIVEEKCTKMEEKMKFYEKKHKIVDEIFKFWENVDKEQKANRFYKLAYYGIKEKTCGPVKSDMNSKKSKSEHEKITAFQAEFSNFW